MYLQINAEQWVHIGDTLRICRSEAVSRSSDVSPSGLIGSMFSSGLFKMKMTLLQQ